MAQNNQEGQENYPIETDDAFTPDQIEEIKSHKERIEKVIAKNDSILRGLEAFFWSISSYSMCRWIVLNLGVSGINLAIALVFIVNQIVNRDCFESFNLNRTNGKWEVNGMSKILKFGFSVVAGLFLSWSAIGEVITFKYQSEQTYEYLTEKTTEFQKLPQKDQKEFIALLVLGCLGCSVFYNFLMTSKPTR